MVEEERGERNGEHDRDEEEEEDVETRDLSLGTLRPKLDEILSWGGGGEGGEGGEKG